jgi:hypothetical protein
MRGFRHPSISEFFNNICAFETLSDVSNRRLADVADSGLGRLNWADFCHSAFARGPTASQQYRTFFAIGGHV